MGAPGKLIVISGPSGSGKTTIVRRLMELEGECLELSISATTRPPRAGEVDGVSYHFLSPDDFTGRRDRGDFLECAEVYPGLWYGTLRSAVSPSLAAGKSVLLEIDVQGMRSVVASCPGVVTLFILPPSWEALEQRLRGRHTETEAAVQRRLEVARREIAAASEYQHRIVNHDVEQSVREIQNLLHAAGERGAPAPDALPRSRLL
jgi:guanylate kinase